MSGDVFAGQYRLDRLAQPCVTVESDHRRGLRQFPGQIPAVALGHAPHRHHRATVLGSTQDRVDGLLFGLGHEAAGVDHHHVCGAIVVGHHAVALRGQCRGQLVGVDVVARTAKRQQRHGARWGHPLRVLPRNTRMHPLTRRAVR